VYPQARAARNGLGPAGPAAAPREQQTGGVDPKQLVADGYDRLFQAYEDWPSAGHDGLRRRYVDTVFDLGLALPAAALDLGCGTGRHGTSYLLEKGLDVTGIDISPRSVAAAAESLPAGRFLVGDMATVELPAASFDLVTAFYSIIHLPREEHAAVFARVAKWLRPGGYLICSLGGGERAGSGIDEAWLGQAPMYWSNWSATTNRQLLAGCGLAIVAADLEAVEEDGQEVTFLWVIGRKTTTG
jgi:SAM-dependent methyltransferase